MGKSFAHSHGRHRWLDTLRQRAKHPSLRARVCGASPMERFAIGKVRPVPTEAVVMPQAFDTNGPAAPIALADTRVVPVPLAPTAVTSNVAWVNDSVAESTPSASTVRCWRGCYILSRTFLRRIIHRLIEERKVLCYVFGLAQLVFHHCQEKVLIRLHQTHHQDRIKTIQVQLKITLELERYELRRLNWCRLPSVQKEAPLRKPFGRAAWQRLALEVDAVR